MCKQVGAGGEKCQVKCVIKSISKNETEGVQDNGEILTQRKGHGTELEAAEVTGIQNILVEGC